MKKCIPVLLAILAVALIAIIDVTYRCVTEPDEVYTMANQHIEWVH